MRLRTRYTQRLPTAPGLLLDVPFFEGSGTKALDISGKGNHGTVFDAVWTRDVNGVAMKFGWTPDMLLTEAGDSLLQEDGNFLLLEIVAYVNCGNDPSLDMSPSVPDFTIVVLPDTQFYSESYPDIFTNQTQWIVDHKNDLNIKFVVHVGDIVDNGYSIPEWDNANTSISILDDEIPYLLIPGNHDYDDLCAAAPRDASNYNTYFPYTRYEKYDWYGGHYPSNGNQNNYGFFSVDTEEFLVLGLEFCPTDATLNWADNVIGSYPSKKVIVFTHSYMYYDDTRAGCSGYSGACCIYGCCGDCNDGEEMWDNLIKKHSNIVLVTNGHFTGDGSGKRTDYVDSHPINQIFQNYQMLVNGGNGWLRYYTFKPVENKIEAKTYSPYLDQYNTSLDNQFVLPYSRKDMTIEAWVKSTMDGLSAEIIEKQSDNIMYQIGVVDAEGEDELRFKISDGTNHPEAKCTWSDYSDGRCHYVAVTRVSGNIYLDVDNSEVDSTSDTAGSILNTGDLFIGKNGNFTIGAVRKYARALSAAERKRSYEQPGRDYIRAS